MKHCIYLDLRQFSIDVRVLSVNSIRSVSYRVSQLKLVSVLHQVIELFLQSTSFGYIAVPSANRLTAVL